MDVVFWNLIEPVLQDHLCKDAQYQPLSPIFIQNLVRDATQLVHTLFVKLPQAEEYRWTGAQRRAYKRDWPNSKDLKGDQFLRNYIPLTIQGTTFSGHPTATTLGNTLRSICYIRFYASEARIPASGYKYFVSGDDVVIFVADRYLDVFLHQMRENTLTSNVPLAKGLGQIVKEINVRCWDDIEFCSKWSFSQGSYDSFGLTRDVQKALLTRQFYNGENALFQSNPDAYVSALLEGFQSEHLSSLMEDIFRARLTGSFQAGLSKLFTYKFEEGGDYEWESEINQRLDIQLSTLYRIVLRNQVMISGREQTSGLNKLAARSSGRQTTRQTQRV